MAGSNEKAVDSTLPDRISTLPDNLKDLILSLMPIHDAVRTSILARNWRHCWHRMGDLVFDEQFVNCVFTSGYKDGDTLVKLSEFSNIISAILIVHIGPIQKFLVHIPKRLVTIWPYFNINLWMLCLSRNGVKHLTIDAWSSAHVSKLPSSVFSCQLLKHLKLSGVRIGDTPHSFEGFPHLNSLDVANVDIKEDALISLISNCPLLETLSLDYCIDHDLEISVPGLRNLFVRDEPSKNIKLKRSLYLSTISLNVQLQARDVTAFFNLVPLVENTTFGGNLVTSLTTADVPTMLPITLAHHKSLTIFSMDVTCPRHISFVFCIIRSSPNLQQLNLPIDEHFDPDDTSALECMEAERKVTSNSSSIRKISIKRLKGKRAEIEFIKTLVSCSPLLDKVFLESVKDIQIDIELQMAVELMRCPRASTKAEIIYSKSSEVSPMNDWDWDLEMRWRKHLVYSGVNRPLMSNP